MCRCVGTGGSGGVLKDSSVILGATALTCLQAESTVLKRFGTGAGASF